MKIDRFFYDKQYFDTATYGHKQYNLQNGSIKNSEHVSHRDQWDEWPKILKALDELCGPIKTILDVGCGCGYSVFKAIENGFDAYGIDYSDSAIELGWNNRKNLLLADAVNLPFKRCSFDLVLSSSVFEHIYLSDIDIALSQIEKVAKKWLFFNIDGAAVFREFELTKDESILPEFISEAIKGHVTNKSYDWWRNKISDHFTIIDELVFAFLAKVPDSFSEYSFKFICRKD